MRIVITGRKDLQEVYNSKANQDMHNHDHILIVIFQNHHEII